MPGILYILTNLILTTTLWGRPYYFLVLQIENLERPRSNQPNVTAFSLTTAASLGVSPQQPAKKLDKNATNITNLNLTSVH